LKECKCDEVEEVAGPFLEKLERLAEAAREQY
jgi:hypothetical protein